MAWQSVDTVPLDFESGIAPERARAIASALRRHVLALLALRDGRAEPLASGALYWLGGRLLLLTCRHVFDEGVALGDVLLPLSDSGRLLPLSRARPRLIEHPERDVAAIVIGDARARQTLLAHWSAVTLAAADPPVCRAPIYAVAGYPYAQMRRLEGRVVARPVVFFARPAASAPAPWLAYGRIARRIDGLHVHAPPLDGVSGATLWAVGDAGEADRCLLQPAGVQCAFKHDAYARGEAFDAAWQLIERAVAN